MDLIMPKAAERARERLRARLEAASIKLPDDQQDRATAITRINELTKTAKGIWFGLLAYMAFVGVTLMGVRDVDFFLPERQTELPLVGVPVPTFLFMAIAPGLGALLYANFHLHLLKHWEALMAAEPRQNGSTLSEHITPWLISDFALSLRNDGALRHRPLRRETNILTAILAYMGTPVLLAAFWYRSAAPHHEWLTLLACGVPLLVTLYVGYASWKRQSELTSNPLAPPRRLNKQEKVWSTLIVLAVTTIGWFRVEGTLEHYAAELGVSKSTIRSSALFRAPFPKFIHSANLVNADLSEAPKEWPEPDEDRIAYRPEWCRIVGLDYSVCGPVTSDTDKPIASIELARGNWCKSLPVDRVPKLDCSSLFASFEKRFEIDWQRRWKRKNRALKSFDLWSADLRNADLVGAQLQGANLSDAQLQQANLSWARLQGANLMKVNLQEARLGVADLHGVNLSFAKLQSAYIGAILDDAFLFRAELHGANLVGAHLRGANLTEAAFQGALLYGVLMNKSTKLVGANFSAAALSGMDLADVPQIGGYVDKMFGDGSVILPDGVERPEHWPEQELEFDQFYDAWRAWQKEIGFDPDDPSTW